jgi:hypothetical protein
LRAKQRRKTPPFSSAGTIAAEDMAEIDAIFARHGCATVPPGWLED